MVTTFYGYKWTVIPDNIEFIKNIPKTGAVYIITIKNETIKRRNVVYVGTSKFVWLRIRTHEILRLLRLNLSGYKIEISYRNFGSHNNNGFFERKIIRYYLPVFNSSYKKDRSQVQTFWSRCGVTNVVYRTKSYRKTFKSYQELQI